MRPHFTIEDFCDLFLEPSQQKIVVIDINDNEFCEKVFEGTASECRISKFRYCTIDSIDTLFEPSDTITVNISSFPEDFESVA